MRIQRIIQIYFQDVFTVIKHNIQEYGDYVVKLVIEEGRKISNLFYELEITKASISRWGSQQNAKKQNQSLQTNILNYIIWVLTSKRGYYTLSKSKHKKVEFPYAKNPTFLDWLVSLKHSLTSISC